MWRVILTCPNGPRRLSIEYPAEGNATNVRSRDRLHAYYGRVPALLPTTYIYYYCSSMYNRYFNTGGIHANLGTLLLMGVEGRLVIVVSRLKSCDGLISQQLRVGGTPSGMHCIGALLRYVETGTTAALDERRSIDRLHISTAAHFWGGGGWGARCQTYYYYYFFPCSADHERDWPRCKVVFFGLATNTLNVRNNCSEGLGAFRFFFKQQEQHFLVLV